MTFSAFSCADLGVDDLLNTISSVIALEGTKAADVDALHVPVCGEEAKSVSFSSTIGREISTTIDQASRHLNSFIGIEAGGDYEAALLWQKCSSLCIITYQFGEFSLLLRENGKICRRERFGCDGRAALSRAHDLGYRTRCSTIETLVCTIGRKDEEVIVCVLSYT